jgi:hypothetical protein
MSYQQAILVAVAAAIFFGPQIASWIRGRIEKGTPSSVRSRWIADILALHDTLKATGRIKAAGLCSQLAQALIEEAGNE